MHPKDVLGRDGERVAAEYLAREGYQILDRNYRCSHGELDIVASDHGALVACEVKTRSGLRYGTPAEAVTRRKLARLRRLAVHWVREHGGGFEELRVDVVGVLRSATGECEISHIRGVG